MFVTWFEFSVIKVYVYFTCLLKLQISNRNQKRWISFEPQNLLKNNNMYIMQHFTSRLSLTDLFMFIAKLQLVSVWYRQ